MIIYDSGNEKNNQDSYNKNNILIDSVDIAKKCSDESTSSSFNNKKTTTVDKKKLTKENREFLRTLGFQTK
jgi:hypothetical protein